MSTPLAGCVITNEKGEVLLLHRNTVRLTQWELPGGKLEPGETAAEAAIREVLEEIGVVVKIIKRLGSTDFDDNNIHWQYTWFRAKILSGKPHPCEADKHDAVGYFDLLQPEINQAGISLNIMALSSALKNKQITL